MKVTPPASSVFWNMTLENGEGASREKEWKREGGGCPRAGKVELRKHEVLNICRSSGVLKPCLRRFVVVVGWCSGKQGSNCILFPKDHYLGVRNI
ncbi:hypothetical protein TNIN_224661 [Trichonephila inaurata madagascariensis]|uniref:Uncharacterized protein n=1 Tax=Trichonephila inaurata madagascariensis TaxID=2747483 RepID=A0A8X7CLK1_9ARAC|nr:hypothetical protein TNIN_224661 [Trichonephila inaurata madagascariensis]